jgi:uncharacterized membrane protein YphA (DoxX/SURF4 family)
MLGTFISLNAALRSLAFVLVLLLVSIVLSGILGPLGFVGLVTWALLLGGIVVGVFLIVLAANPLAGAGAILMPASTWMAFFVQPPAFVWTGFFFLGAILIACGASLDTPDKRSWPIALLRVMVGWAWVDNAQDHFLSGWVPAGGGFLQTATNNANRQPLHFLDPLYQDFLKSVVVPGGGQWAALTMCGELAFGLLMAMGAFTPIAALGLLWHSSNYILMRGFTPHGAYVDKTFFAVDLVCLIVLAGLAYGLDATLRRYIPDSLARALTGTTGAPSAPAPTESPRP